MACHPRTTCHTAGCCHLANSMSLFQSYVSHCRVLPPGEFNGMSSQSHIAGSCHLVNSLSRFQSHVAGCSHLAKSMSWSCHIAGCKNSIRHIENRFSLYFLSSLTLTSGGFCIVSDTLVTFKWNWKENKLDTDWRQTVLHMLGRLFRLDVLHVLVVLTAACIDWIL